MNVLLIIVDSLRRDHIGAYGNKWIHTPNLDALSKESMNFMRVYPESTPSISARRAIHTGLRSFPFRGWHKWSEDDVGLRGWQPIPQYQTTLAEILGGEEFTNVLVTDTLHEFRAFYDFQRGFDSFEFIRGQTTDNYKPSSSVPPEKIEQSLLAGNVSSVKANLSQYFANVADRRSEEDWFAPHVFSQASEHLEWASNAGRPFFMVVDSYDPHEPWDPSDKYVSLYDDEYDGLEPYIPVYGPSDYLTGRQLERMKALYAGEVTMADRWLGHFLDKMEELKLMDNTLLILLSDHGVALGEHGIVGKPSYALWPEVTDIVYLIRHPEGKGAGTTNGYYASTHDVASTALGFLGLETPEQTEGEDLSVIFEGGEPEAREHFSSGYHTSAWARDERYVFFSRQDGSDAHLYDVQQDPEAKRDIAASNQEILNKMFNDYILADAGGQLPSY